MALITKYEFSDTIKCPYCGYEYHPAEIFYPTDLLEKPDVILRDDNGNFHGTISTSADGAMTETYVCDKCGKEFTVKARVQYAVIPSNCTEAQTLYTTTLSSTKKFTLTED